jgi:Tol biopolymer transport system component
MNSATLLLFFLPTLNPQAQDTIPLGKHFYLNHIKEVVKGDPKPFTSPVLSPDGKYFIYTTEAFRELYLKKTDSDSPATIIASGKNVGYLASWSNDNQRIYFRLKLGSRMSDSIKLKYYDVRTRLVWDVPKVNPDAIESFAATEKDKHPLVYIDYKTTKLMAETKDGTKKWEIAPESAMYQPKLSPNKELVAVHRGINIYIYKIDGTGLVATVGKGLATSWSPDSRYLLGFLDVSQTKALVGSELFVFDVKSGYSHIITNTTDSNEMYPCWSRDGKKLMFSEGNKSGSIMEAEMVEY